MPDLTLQVLTFIDTGETYHDIDEEFLDELDLQLQINETELNREE